MEVNHMYFSFCKMFLGLVFFSTIYQVQSFVSFENNANVAELELGRSEFDRIRRESEKPRYGACWKQALENVEQGCKRLTDGVQQRLALGFTNCFLEASGLSTYPCEQNEEIKTCIVEMDGKAFGTYTNFFTHTQNICFFLQSQIWQENADQTITKLSSTSEEVASQLEQSQNIQSELIKKQNDTLSNQEKLLRNGIDLSKTIEQSSSNVHALFEDFKHATYEQRAMIGEVFDRVSKLQSVVLGEFTGFYSIIFYALSVVIAYLITATPRTSGARFYLFAIMTGNVVLERLIVSYSGEDPRVVEGVFLDASALIYGRLWWCRKIFSAFALIILAMCAYKYRDLNKVNNELLLEIKRQNLELKGLLSLTSSPLSSPPQLQYSSSPSSIQSSSITLNHISRTVPPVTTSRMISASSDITDGNGSEMGDYDSESDSDTTSIMTDRTFQIEEVSDQDVSDSETNSSVMSYVSVAELEDIRDATPLRDLTPRPNSRSSNESGYGTPRRVGRPPGRRKQTPVIDTNRYNLRSRSHQISNPVVNSESPETFARIVKGLAKQAWKNSMRARYQLSQGYATPSTSGTSYAGSF